MPNQPTSPAAANRPPRIVLCYPVESKHVAQIAAVAPRAEIVDAGQERVATELMAADIFCGHAKVPVPWDDVVRQGRLKWIQSSAAGMDHCLVPSVIASAITVTSASGVLADQVADHTLALLTALLRSLPTFWEAQQKREFIRRPTRDLHRARIGIIGLGGNGRRIAQVLAPFRVRILATDMFPHSRPPEVEAIRPANALHEVLSQVDIAILCVPLNAQTHHMIDATALAGMRPGAMLINVARGPVVDEAALVQALQSGQLAAAGVDVTEVEPLPESSPLWELPNVLITPHVGAQSATRVDDSTQLFCENLERY